MTFDEILASRKHVAVLSILPPVGCGVLVEHVQCELRDELGLRLIQSEIGEIINECRKAGLVVVRSMGSRCWRWQATREQFNRLDLAYCTFFPFGESRSAARCAG